MLQPQNKEEYFALGQVGKSVFGEVLEVRARFSKISDSPSVVRTFKNPRYWTSREAAVSAVNSALRSVEHAVVQPPPQSSHNNDEATEQAASPALPVLPIPAHDATTVQTIAVPARKTTSQSRQRSASNNSGAAKVSKRAAKEPKSAANTPKSPPPPPKPLTGPFNLPNKSTSIPLHQQQAGDGPLPPNAIMNDFLSEIMANPEDATDVEDEPETAKGDSGGHNASSRRCGNCFNSQSSSWRTIDGESRQTLLCDCRNFNSLSLSNVLLDCWEYHRKYDALRPSSQWINDPPGICEARQRIIDRADEPPPPPPQESFERSWSMVKEAKRAENAARKRAKKLRANNIATSPIRQRKADLKRVADRDPLSDIGNEWLLQLPRETMDEIIANANIILHNGKENAATAAVGAMSTPAASNKRSIAQVSPSPWRSDIFSSCNRLPAKAVGEKPSNHADASSAALYNHEGDDYEDDVEMPDSPSPVTKRYLTSLFDTEHLTPRSANALAAMFNQDCGSPSSAILRSNISSAADDFNHDNIAASHHPSGIYEFMPSSPPPLSRSNSSLPTSTAIDALSTEPLTATAAIDEIHHYTDSLGPTSKLQFKELGDNQGVAINTID